MTKALFSSQKWGHARNRGFTFIELLVAGFLGAIVLVTTYLIFTANSRQYYVQEQIVQMQEGMRFAVEYLKGDLRSAGRLVVVNGVDRFNGRADSGRDPQFCRIRSNYRAIELLENRATPAVLTRYNNQLRPDRLRLLVDGSGAAPMTINRIQGTNVVFEAPLQQPSTASRRIIENQSIFNDSFKPGYFLYIMTRGGETDLVPIQAVVYAQDGPRVRLSAETCPTGGGGTFASKCFGGDCLAVPVQWIEYAVDADENMPEKTRLVRRVIHARTGNVLPAETINLADYIVDFQVWGTYDTRPEGAPVGTPPAIAVDDNPIDDIGNWRIEEEQLIMNRRPDRIRSLNVILAMRTEREDPGFRVAPDRDDAPSERVLADRTWFELNASSGTGYARVATIQTELEAPNMYRGTR